MGQNLRTEHKAKSENRNTTWKQSQIKDAVVWTRVILGQHYYSDST
jgi:hypothetical protein